MVLSTARAVHPKTVQNTCMGARCGVLQKDFSMVNVCDSIPTQGHVDAVNVRNVTVRFVTT